MRKSPLSATGQKTGLSQFLLEFRNKRQLTQLELQRLLGWQSPGYVSKIETGLIMMPDLGFLKSLAKESGVSLNDLQALCQMPFEESSFNKSRHNSHSSPQKFKLIFGHSLWGAPIFHATHEGRLPEFEVTSFAKDSGSGVISGTDLVWVEPRKTVVTPGPGVKDLVALSSMDVLSLLRQGEADIGAIPGNIVPDSAFVRIATIVDSAAGCTFVTENNRLKKWLSEGLIHQQFRGRRQQKQGAEEITTIGTRELYGILRAEQKQNKQGVRIAVEEGTIGHEFLKNVCQQDKNEPLIVNDLNWLFRTSDLASKRFETLKAECRQEHGGAELLGVIVWEPHATWMTILQSNPQLRRVPLHLAPNELGRPHHLSYEIVIRENRRNLASPRDQEFRGALTKLLYELWDSADRLNELRSDAINQTSIDRLARYYGFARNSGLDDQATKHTLNAVGTILYSVRWSVKGHNLLV